MIPEFPRITYAINQTFAYYRTGRIAEHFRALAGEKYLNYLDDFIEATYTALHNMEKEINQNLHSSSQTVQDEMLDMLKKWHLQDDIVRIGYIKNLIDEYNDREYISYAERIEQEEEKFRSTVNYNLKHNDKYTIEVVVPTWMRFMSETGLQKKQKINSYFYCNIEEPEYLKIEYLPDYVKIIEPILKEFRRLTDKYITRMESRRVLSVHQILIANPQNESEDKKPHQQLLDTQIQQSKKLKTTLTAGQIIYLFQTLKNIGVLENGISKVDICRFIAANLSTESYDDLSADNLAKKWSNVPINDIAFWYDYFPEMSKQVMKDNPNKIKYKPKKTN